MMKLGLERRTRMLFSDDRCGKAFAKDPAVVFFRGRYYMYYSTLQPEAPQDGFRIGIAVSDDGCNWKICGLLPLTQACEEKGIAAPGAVVLGNRVHLFYQTYGNGKKDAICHAESGDGVTFGKDPDNPIFRPTGDWCCGRAIDADVCLFQNRLYLYTATRDHGFSVQKIAAAFAELNEDGTGFGPFQQLCRGAVLFPELIWEQNCTEAPACLVQDGRLYLFYGGAYNCAPQQIGCAVSIDGRTFDKLFLDKPMIPNGQKGSFNASESGHPIAFRDVDGKVWLYYQGSPDNGDTWYLSRIQISFDEKGIPYTVNPLP